MNIKNEYLGNPENPRLSGDTKNCLKNCGLRIFTELESDRCTQNETHDWSAQLILNWTQKVRNCKTQHTFWVLWVENQILHTFSISANCKMNNIKWISLKTLKIRGCQGEQTALPKEMWFYDLCKTRVWYMYKMSNQSCDRLMRKKIKIHDRFGQLILNWTHKVRNCKTQYFWVLWDCNQILHKSYSFMIFAKQFSSPRIHLENSGKSFTRVVEKNPDNAMPRGRGGGGGALHETKNKSMGRKKAPKFSTGLIPSKTHHTCMSYVCS